MKLSVFKNGIFFPEDMINEDLIFGFEVFLKAETICFVNANFLYRIREGSISHPKTFFQHNNALLFRSYKRNTDYLLELLQNQNLAFIFPLLRRCLIACAQIPVRCWIQDATLCHQAELEKLVPYMKKKTYYAYRFPKIARLASSIKAKLTKLRK